MGTGTGIGFMYLYWKVQVRQVRTPGGWALTGDRWLLQVAACIQYVVNRRTVCLGVSLRRYWQSCFGKYGMVLQGFIVVVGSVGIPRAANRAQNIIPAEIRVWSEHYSGKFLIRFGHPCGDTCLSGKYQRDVGIPETVSNFCYPSGDICMVGMFRREVRYRYIRAREIFYVENYRQIWAFNNVSALGYNPAEIYVMALGIPAGQYNPNFACKGGQHLKNAYIRTDTVHVTHSMKFIS